MTTNDPYTHALLEDIRESARNQEKLLQHILEAIRAKR
jgi:hypothetical protein